MQPLCLNRGQELSLVQPGLWLPAKPPCPGAGGGGHTHLLASGRVSSRTSREASGGIYRACPSSLSSRGCEGQGRPSAFRTESPTAPHRLQWGSPGPHQAVPHPACLPTHCPASSSLLSSPHCPGTCPCTLKVPRWVPGRLCQRGAVFPFLQGVLFQVLKGPGCLHVAPAASATSPPHTLPPLPGSPCLWCSPLGPTSVTQPPALYPNPAARETGPEKCLGVWDEGADPEKRERSGLHLPWGPLPQLPSPWHALLLAPSPPQFEPPCPQAQPSRPWGAGLPCPCPPGPQHR